MSTYCVSGPMCPALGCCVRAFRVSENGLLSEHIMCAKPAQQRIHTVSGGELSFKHSLREHLRLCAWPQLLCDASCVPAPVWPWLPTVCPELGFCVSIS